MKKTTAVVVLLVLLTNRAAATFPDVPLDGGIFSYGDPLFMGDYFSFATDLSYTEGRFPSNTTTKIGLTGFSVPSGLIEPVPGFMSGDEVPVNGQGLSDLFPDSVPFGLDGIWAGNSISAVGDFTSGFSQFAVHQQKLAQVSQDGGELIDGFVEAKANVPFEVNSQSDAPVPANIDVHLDSFFAAEGTGGLSEGIEVKLLDVTDPENPMVIEQVSGFFFLFDGFFDASFTADDMDVSDSFEFLPSGETFASPTDTNFAYDQDIFLDPTKTYSVNISSDAGTSVTDNGLAGIDSTNTLDVTISLLDPTATLIIPGTTVIPEPSSVCLLGIASLAFCLRHTRR